ncbi:MAG: multiprotein bridging factor aMBF1 [Thermosphaera sp.]
MPCYCEICGREVENNRDCRKIVLEGSVLIACPQCFNRLVNQGKARPFIEERKAKPQPQKAPISQPRPKPIREEYEVVEDYAKRVKEARERLGWTQQVLAQKVRESENIIKRIEAGRLKPGIDLARRLERALGIKLLEPVVDESTPSLGKSEDFLTIGDLVKLNKNDQGET